MKSISNERKIVFASKNIHINISFRTLFISGAYWGAYFDQQMTIWTTLTVGQL